MAEDVRFSYLLCFRDSETCASISFLVSVTVGAEAQRIASYTVSVTSHMVVGFNNGYTNVRGLL